MAYQYIIEDITDGLGTITLNRPPVNVLNIAMMEEINDVLQDKVSFLQSSDYRLGARINLELIKNISQMGLNGASAQVKLTGHLRITMSFSKQLKHFCLPISDS